MAPDGPKWPTVWCSDAGALKRFARSPAMPYILHFSHHVTTLVPGKPQLLLQTREVTLPWLIGDFVIALPYHTLFLTKLVPPGLGPSSLSHLRQVLQRTPTLPLKQSQRVGWGREKNSIPRTLSGSFLYTPQPLPPPVKHRKTHFLSHSSLQKKNRGRVKVCGIWLHWEWKNHILI